MSYIIILNLKRNRPQQCQLEYVSGDTVKPGFTLLDKNHPDYESIKQAFLTYEHFDLQQEIALLVTFAKEEPFQYKLTDIYFTLHAPRSNIPQLSPFMMERYNQQGIVEKVPTPNAYLAFSSIVKHTNHDPDMLQQIENGKICFKINTLDNGESLPANAILPVQASKQAIQHMMEQHFNSWNNRLLKIKQIPHSVMQLASRALQYGKPENALELFKNTLNFLVLNPAISLNMGLVMQAYLLPVAFAQNTNKIPQMDVALLTETIDQNFMLFKDFWLKENRSQFLLGEFIEELRLTAFHNPTNIENPFVLNRFREHFNQLQNEIGIPLLQHFLIQDNFDFKTKRYLDFMIKSVGMDINHIFSPSEATLLAIMCASPQFYPIESFEHVLALGANPHGNDFNKSPMYNCIYKGNAEVLKRMIAHGGQLIVPGYNMVCVALLLNQVEIAELLLREYGIKPDYGIEPKRLRDKNTEVTALTIPVLAAIQSRKVEYLDLLFEYGLQPSSLVLLTEEIFTIILSFNDREMAMAVLEKIAQHDEELALRWMNGLLTHIHILHTNGYYPALLRHFQAISKNEKIHQVLTDKVNKLDGEHFHFVKFMYSSLGWLLLPVFYKLIQYVSKNMEKNNTQRSQEKHILKQLQQPKQPKQAKKTIQKPQKTQTKLQDESSINPEIQNRETLATINALFPYITAYEENFHQTQKQLDIMSAQAHDLPVPDVKLNNILLELKKWMESNSLDYVAKIKKYLEDAQTHIQKNPTQTMDIGNIQSQVNNLVTVKATMKTLQSKAEAKLAKLSKTAHSSVSRSVISSSHPAVNLSRTKKKKKSSMPVPHSIFNYPVAIAPESTRPDRRTDIPQIPLVKPIEYNQKDSSANREPAHWNSQMRTDERILQLNQIVQTMQEAISQKDIPKKVRIDAIHQLTSKCAELLYEISYGPHSYAILASKIPDGKNLKRYRNTVLHYFESFHKLDEKIVLEFAQLFLEMVEPAINLLVTGEELKHEIPFANLKKLYPTLFDTSGNEGNSVKNNLQQLERLCATMQEYRKLEESLGDKVENNRVLRSAMMSCLLQVRELHKRFNACEENSVYAQQLASILSGDWIQQTNRGAAHFQYTDTLFAKENPLLEIEMMNYKQLSYAMRSLCAKRSHVTKIIVEYNLDLLKKERANNPDHLRLGMFNRETTPLQNESLTGNSVKQRLG